MTNKRLSTVCINEAIEACKILKRASIHTPDFMRHHSQLVTIQLLKEWGFTRIQLYRGN